MKTVISAKLKLNTTPEQFAQLRATQLAYRDALNFVSQYSYAHGKTSNRVTLHKANYGDVRARFHLPSQMACSVFRQIGATYKGLQEFKLSQVWYTVGRKRLLEEREWN